MSAGPCASTVRGCLSFEDYLAACRLHGQADTRRAWLLIGTLAMAAVAALLVHQLVPAAALAAGAIAGSVSVLIARPLRERRLRRLFEQQKDFRGEFVYAWDDAGLHGRCTFGESRRPWTHFLRVRSSDRLALLYHHDALYEVFPARWFDSPAHYAGFLATARAGLASKRAADGNGDTTR